jgi:hypothetical protein
VRVVIVDDDEGIRLGTVAGLTTQAGGMRGVTP